MDNPIAVGTAVTSAIAFGAILTVVILRKRLGELKVASWLVVFGAVVVATEHPHFGLAEAAMFPYEVHDDLRYALLAHPHARLHFLMASVFAAISVVLIAIIARTLLREGRWAGWYAVSVAVVLGAAFEVLVAGPWYPKGSPLYALVGIDNSGWGWNWLYLYMVAWTAALAISFRPIFLTSAPKITRLT